TLVGRKFLMKWVKPEFEIVDLCSEVTSYLYHR
ncbi:MAG: pyrroloquinoline quinone precursor peptide PqqA, partial [Solirubrobacterales bacterium]|nr:pyrroloquinoline quinone precursor peptide PqqA [Solirubrobacterales bacterium]